MIVSFRHKGLRKYFESGSLAGIQPAHARRLQMQLAALDTAATVDDMEIPGFEMSCTSPPLIRLDQEQTYFAKVLCRISTWDNVSAFER